MKFKTKLLNALVLSALGAASGAQAVTLGENGTGEVLLYPYYTVQGGNDTLISVVNSTNAPKAVKVRIIEAKNSREVIDFNLYLSPFDAWSAAITTDSATGGAKLLTADKSCTVPAIPSSGVTFRNFAYTGTANDNAEDTLARTREGYVEIIEMGVVNSSFDLDAAGPGTATFGPAVTHVNGVPANCAAVVGAWTPVTGAFVTQGDELTEPTGGLFGSGTLINVAEGTDYSYDPVALDAFNNIPVGIHTEPGNLLPSLNNVAPVSSTVFVNGAPVTTDWGPTTDFVDNVDAVSAVLMRNSVMNEYVTNPELAAGSDFVVTFPTKQFYVVNDNGVAPAEDSFRPFSEPFLSTGACEPVGLQIVGREEEQPVVDIDFSPPPPGGTNALCWEANVITVNGSNVLSSANVLNINAAPVDGWLTVSFPVVAGGALNGALAAADGHRMLDDNPADATPLAVSYEGLPVIGFGVQKYVNNNVGGVLSNYGGSFVHKYTRSITLP